MPELPEVEVVRAGLAPAITGARVAGVQVFDARALKRHRPESDPGIGGVGVALDEQAAMLRRADFERRMLGAMLAGPVRRGKFLWIPVEGSEDASTGIAAASAAPAPRRALLAHLGMSGQLLLRSHEAPDDRHLRVRLWIEHPQHGELRVDFADQRLFGSLALDRLIPVDPASGPGSRPETIPSQVAHIARDPLDPVFSDAAFTAALRTRGTAVKRALLDQQLISGVGNIYADETLWRARIHPETPGTRLSERKAEELLSQLRAVFAQALAEGGTSFDQQYVNVNGQAGYFAHSLKAYGRGGEPCHRCGSPIRRVAFMNRSSHFCPRCQRRR